MMFAHSINVFLLLMGIAQGLLVGYFLIRKRQSHPSHLFLLLLLTVIGLQLTVKLLSKVWLMQNVYPLYDLSYYFPYLIGPLLYLFIQARIGVVPSVRHGLHFAPFALMIVLCGLQWSDVKLDPISDFLLWPYTRATGQMISLVIYAWFSWKLVSNTVEPLRKGLTQFLKWAVGAEAIVIVTLAVMYVYFGRFPDVRLLFVVLTLLMYWISYQLLAQPELFMVKSIGETVPLKIEPISKYAHSGLKPEEADRIAQQLKDTMMQHRYYLRSDLTIEVLASHLNVTRHHLSQVMNERFGKSYFEYVNGWRLEEARQRLANPKYGHYTINAIALDAGFSSVSSFNEMFKRQFQCTPSQFRSHHQNAKSA